MSLLKDLVKEMAASGSIGADSIANVPGSLFTGGVVDLEREKKKQKRRLRRAMNLKTKRLKESLGVNLGASNFDAADVISKIDSAQRRQEVNDDTVPFGLEDEDGNIIKVYVKSDQAENFEKELANLLAGDVEDDEDRGMEIAELLFNLKDKYDIVNVEWPHIEGDEEEEQEVEPEASPEGEDFDFGDEEGADEDADVGNLDDLDLEEPESDKDAGDMVADEESAKSALQKVIDMMKADAEAREAEARAKEAEARAKEAEYAAQAAAAKIRKEEQILDMEAKEKAAKEREKEAKQLAKLARYQHRRAQDAEVSLSMESIERKEAKLEDPWKTNDIDDEDNYDLTLQELSYYILRNLSHNG